MRVVRSFIFQGVFFVWGALLCLLWMPLLYLPGVPRWLHVVFQTFWCRSVRFWLWFLQNLTMEVRGRQHIAPGPVIYAMKHQSMLDTFVMHSILHDPAFIMKQELLNIPLYGRLCYKVGNIPINRTMGAAAMKLMLKRSREEIERNRSVVIFPEGSRAAPGGKHPYLSGIYGIYKYLKVPVVPIAVNTGLFWPKRGPINPGRFVIEFLPPIEPGLTKDDFMERLETTIETASQKLLP